MEIKGYCLCRELTYRIYSETGEIYQCHCSKCRRVTGSSANANTIVAADRFSWLKEPLTLKRYVRDGWVSAFCSVCGAKAPIEDRKSGIFYVPAGSLEQHDVLKVTKHIHVESKASWDEIGGLALQKPRM